jgi:hypothetical protein
MISSTLWKIEAADCQPFIHSVNLTVEDGFPVEDGQGATQQIERRFREERR